MPPNDSNLSHKAQLAGLILGVSLEDWVNDKRDYSKSWDSIAIDLAVATAGRVTYSGEHLRRLFKPAPENGAAA
jgi:hypothetical protein